MHVPIEKQSRPYIVLSVAENRRIYTTLNIRVVTLKLKVVDSRILFVSALTYSVQQIPKFAVAEGIGLQFFST